MPDITMCKGSDCPQKLKCYRYTAVPSRYRQAYFSQIIPVDCELFLDNKGKQNNDPSL